MPALFSHILSVLFSFKFHLFQQSYILSMYRGRTTEAPQAGQARLRGNFILENIDQCNSQITLRGYPVGSGATMSAYAKLHSMQIVHG